MKEKTAKLFITAGICIATILLTACGSAKETETTAETEQETIIEESSENIEEIEEPKETEEDGSGEIAESTGLKERKTYAPGTYLVEGQKEVILEGMRILMTMLQEEASTFDKADVTTEFLNDILSILCQNDLFEYSCFFSFCDETERPLTIDDVYHSRAYNVGTLKNIGDFFGKAFTEEDITLPYVETDGDTLIISSGLYMGDWGVGMCIESYNISGDSLEISIPYIGGGDDIEDLCTGMAEAVFTANPDSFFGYSLESVIFINEDSMDTPIYPKEEIDEMIENADSDGPLSGEIFYLEYSFDNTRVTGDFFYDLRDLLYAKGAEQDYHIYNYKDLIEYQPDAVLLIGLPAEDYEEEIKTLVEAGFPVFGINSDYIEGMVFCVNGSYSQSDEVISIMIEQLERYFAGEDIDEGEIIISPNQMEEKRLSLDAENYDSSEDNQTNQGNTSSGINVANVTASSTLTDNGMIYSPEFIIDNDFSTAWAEGVTGLGVGESVTFTLADPATVSGIMFNGGYQKSEDLYYKNSRPHKIKVNFSDGESQSMEIPDYMGAFVFRFSEPIETDSITITIESAYPGSAYEDTLISEIKIF